MTVLNRHYEQLWDDTLYDCFVLLKAGKVLNRDEYVDEARFQFLFHIKYLQDKRQVCFIMVGHLMVSTIMQTLFGEEETAVYIKRCGVS